MVNGQYSIVNDQWSMVKGKWSMVNGQWSMVNGQNGLPHFKNNFQFVFFIVISKIRNLYKSVCPYIPLSVCLFATMSECFTCYIYVTKSGYFSS